MTTSSSSSRDAATPSENLHTKCLDHVDDVLKNVNTVSYIVDVLKQLGNDFGPSRVRCVPSAVARAETSGSDHGRDGMAEAGYMWADTRIARRGDIVLHEDQLRSRDDVERSLRHELIHAFDDTRGFIEPTNCYHHACSEIRAARLSGDCFVGMELRRGNFDLFGGRNCVKRRAAMAVENNPMCRHNGQRSVDAVFAACYTDYEPFVAPIYNLGSERLPTVVKGDGEGQPS
jgi:inner membrane protease ATP23